MTTDYKTPGVYINEIPTFPPSVAAVETAIPAFIGYTQDQKHLTDKEIVDNLIKAVRITSLVEYQTYFGNAQPEEGISISAKNAAGDPVITVNFDETKLSKFKLFYSLQFYFANGGGPCYIISVGKYDKNGGLVLSSDLADGLEASKKIDEVTLILFTDAQALTTATDYYNLQVAALKSCADLMDRFVVMDVYRADQKTITDATATEDDKSPVAILRSKIGTDNLKYGAAYYPNVDTSLDFVIDDSKVTVDGTTLDTLKKGNNAQYFQIISAIRDQPMRMPPSAGIAGIYADTDSTRGVWKAPANTNMDLVIRPSQIISHEEHEGLNVDARDGKSINVIRSFPGRGPAIVWGARTLAGNDNEWRYVSVRRFCNMVEESVKNACGQFVFEPNDANTWVRVRAMIENFLILQWRAGALQGAKPDHAFYVAVGLNQTMTGLDVLEGRMIVEIGMAIVRPAEFIILNFSQMMPQS
ncbi:phage tail sheath family protein [Spirosoma validum]|uniref:Phage tail sheath family protein n=1 Tax=Spirosoma validum TaxID=2771355 RepID=A0A927GD03_9BACT|nr:phage tail sheath C-terminal domain-containing protein [Spirosoma validum]MBD2753204.1 phage tail sheath family protein [Spirosoma validum]